MDMSILITGAVMLGGYIMKQNSKASNKKEPLGDDDTKYTNVYTSHMVEDAKKQEQILADKITARPNLGEKVYVSSAIGLPGGVSSQEGFTSSEELTAVYNNTMKDPINKVIKITQDKNMDFKPKVENMDGEYASFNDGAVSTRSMYTNNEVELDESIVPFATKDYQEVRERYTPVLFNDKYKKEVGTFTEGIRVENVYTGTLYDVGMDRFIPSRLKTGEKPFEPQRFGAPPIGSEEAPTFKYKTVDELRVNPKTSYKGRVVEGKMQSANTRGIQAPVRVNRPTTLTEKQYLVPDSHLKGPMIKQDYIPALKKPSKLDYLENDYIAPLQNSSLNSGSARTEEYDKSSKQESEGVFTVNAASLNMSTGDYQKSAQVARDTERNTYESEPILNINAQSVNLRVRNANAPKTTGRELGTTNTGLTNIRGEHLQSSSAAIHAGITGIQAQTTMKEQNLFGYNGIAKAEVQGLSYLVANYDAKTTFKEIIYNRLAKHTKSGSINTFSGVATRGEEHTSDNKLMSELENMRFGNSSANSAGPPLKTLFGKSTTLLDDNQELFDRNDESFQIR